MSNVEEAKVAREKLDPWLVICDHNQPTVTKENQKTRLFCCVFFLVGMVNTIGNQGLKKKHVGFNVVLSKI